VRDHRKATATNVSFDLASPVAAPRLALNAATFLREDRKPADEKKEGRSPLFLLRLPAAFAVAD